MVRRADPSFWVVRSASRRVRRLRQSRAVRRRGTLSASHLALPTPTLRRQPSPTQTARFTSSSAAPLTAKSRCRAARSSVARMAGTCVWTLVQPKRRATDRSPLETASATLAFDGTVRKSGSQSARAAVDQKAARTPLTAGSLP